MLLICEFFLSHYYAMKIKSKYIKIKTQYQNKKSLIYIHQFFHFNIILFSQTKLMKVILFKTYYALLI